MRSGMTRVDLVLSHHQRPHPGGRCPHPEDYMRIKTTLALLATAVVAAGVMAPAANAADTIVTVEVTGNPLGLSVSAPATAGAAGAPLATAAAGAASMSGSLGNVVVTDTRAALVASWD